MTAKKRSAAPQQKRHETAQEWADRVIRERGPIPDRIIRDIRDQLHAGKNRPA